MTLLSLYIGQPARTLRERFGEHRRGVQNNIDESVPIHFNLPHHTLNDVELIPLRKVRNSRASYRYTMEQQYISTAGNVKKWYKSDQRSLIIILPLYIVQHLHCIYSYSPCFILQSCRSNHIRGTCF